MNISQPLSLSGAHHRPDNRSNYNTLSTKRKSYLLATDSWMPPCIIYIFFRLLLSCRLGRAEGKRSRAHRHLSLSNRETWPLVLISLDSFSFSLSNAIAWVPLQFQHVFLFAFFFSSFDWNKAARYIDAKTGLMRICTPFYRAPSWLVYSITISPSSSSSSAAVHDGNHRFLGML